MLTLIDRSSGEARSFHIDKVDAVCVVPIVRQNVARESAIATDEAQHYTQLKQDYHHVAVNHAREEWAIGEFHTNSARTTFRSSSAACAVCISTARKSTCTAIWQSSITAIRTV